MRGFNTALAAAGLAVCLTLPAAADPAPVCLQSYLIDHTTVQDTKTILFHMKGGKIWKNALLNDCPGLKFHGFVMNFGGTTTVCSNQMTIRVLETHETCMMGEFTPYVPPPKVPAVKS